MRDDLRRKRRTKKFLFNQIGGLDKMSKMNVIVGGVPDVFLGCFLELGAILGLKARKTRSPM